MQEYEKYQMRKNGGGFQGGSKEDAEYYKIVAQVVLAFSVGVLVGMTSLKKAN